MDDNNNNNNVNSKPQSKNKSAKEIIEFVKNNDMGVDLELLKRITEIVSIPIIASGGVGTLDHLVEGIKVGKANAVLAASIFHFGRFTIKDVRKEMRKNNISVRRR